MTAPTDTAMPHGASSSTVTTFLYDCKIKNDGRSRNTKFFTIEGDQIREVEVYFGSAPRGTA